MAIVKRQLFSPFIFLIVCGCFFTTRLPAASDWPEFRGPTGQGISNATNVPVHWSATSNIVWKTSIPGEGWSSPVIEDGKIYLTTATKTGRSGDVSLRVVCVAAKGGKVLWNIEVLKPNPDATQEIHNKNTLASPTPIVRDGRIYVHFGHMGTAALNLSGNILWRQTDLKYSPTHGNGGSPVLVGDSLVFSCDGNTDPFVVALNAMNGQVLWKTPRRITVAKPFSFATPLALDVNGVTQIISPGSGLVAAYDVKDGREIWRVRYDGFSLIPRPVFAHGMLFLSSGFMKPVLHAIKPDGAKGDVTETHVAWTHAKGAPNTPSPLVVGDELYIVSDGGIGTCFDARTGAVHWNERLGGDVSASPVLADGRIYFQNEEGIGYVVKAGKNFELLAKNNLGERTLASPAALDGALFLRSKSHLWRIGKDLDS